MCDDVCDNSYNSDSSFYDDAVYESEEEFFTSDWEEGDANGYLPPLSRNKEHYAFLLDAFSPKADDEDEQLEFKEFHIRNIIRKWESFINNRRAWYAYKRMTKVMSSSYDPSADAFVLEKMELKDKKLNRNCYYEFIEPTTYKKLLTKRRAAIKRKYQMYALDSEWRAQYQNEVMDKGQLVRCRKVPPFFLDMASYADHMKKEEEDDEEEEEEEYVVEQGSDSSFYDDDIPSSEVEFMTENFNIELPCPHPGPVSRTYGKYKRLLAKSAESDDDDPVTKERKLIRRAEILASWFNFRDKKKAIKAMSRIQAAEAQEFENLEDEAGFLEEYEVSDKKLNREFYYACNEPGPYVRLLELRLEAIRRKYQQYIEDEDFRNRLKEKTYAEFLRVRDSPMFEKPLDEVDSESSINDSDIPTSEDDFMSQTELCVPEANIDRPHSRVREAFYHEMDLFEPGDKDTNREKQIKRLMRYILLMQYKGYLIHRRHEKAKRRLDIVKSMGATDAGTKAYKLLELELKDKHLDKPFMYFPGEDCVYTELRNKRVRAIERKYDRFIEDRDFRKEYEERINSEVKAHIRT